MLINLVRLSKVLKKQHRIEVYHEDDIIEIVTDSFGTIMQEDQYNVFS